MKTIYCLLALLIASASLAQKSPRYKGNFEMGIVNGTTETEAFLQTTHGLQYRGWFAGLGTGIDYYRFRTVPLLLELRKQFTNKTARPFVSLAGGLNLPWLMTSEKQEHWNWGRPITFSEYDAGYALRAGAGVVLKAESKINFSLSAGWSRKTLLESFTETDFSQGPQPSTGVEKKLDHQLNRAFVSFAVNF